MELQRLKPSQKEAAVAMLVRAFWDYPQFSDYFPDEVDRARFAPYFIRVAIGYAMRFGEVYVTSPNLEGVAMWHPPKYTYMNTWRLFWSVPPQVMWGFKRNGGAIISEGTAKVEAMHREAAPMPHWFLHIIGVDPNHQGLGHASRLIRNMLGRTDREGLPVFLETVNGANVPRYEHFGFRVVDQSPLPGVDVTNWSLFRDCP